MSSSPELCWKLQVSRPLGSYVKNGCKVPLGNLMRKWLHKQCIHCHLQSHLHIQFLGVTPLQQSPAPPPKWRFSVITAVTVLMLTSIITVLCAPPCGSNSVISQPTLKSLCHCLMIDLPTSALIAPVITWWFLLPFFSTAHKI